MIRIFTITIAAMLLLTETAFGAAFMKLGDIKGEATDSKHKEWIEILSFSQAISKPGGAATGATRRRGGAIVEDMTISKKIDSSTPLISRALVQGQAFPEAIVIQSFNGNSYKIRLENVVVTSVAIQGADNGPPTEEVSFSFSKITWTYDGQGRKPVEAGWDNVRNTPRN